MTPEKIAVLAITGVIAILLSVTLMGSPATQAEPLPRPEAVPATTVPLSSGADPWTFEDMRAGQARTRDRPKEGVRPPAKPPESSPASSPPSRGGGMHTVASGDRLELIALRVYGRREAVKDILAANPGLDARRMRVGQEIQLPLLVGRPIRSSPEGGQTASAPPQDADQGPGWHTVARGEVLSSIAHQRYGRASEWSRIFDANRGILERPDRLQPGMRLRIPKRN